MADLIDRIRAYEGDQVAVVGRLVAPCAGCFYLNALAIPSNSTAYMVPGLGGTSYARYSVDGTRVALDFLDEVLSPDGDDYRLVSLSAVAPYTPHDFTGDLLTICAELNYDTVAGCFRCDRCGVDLYDLVRAGESLYYLPENMRGGGGVNIEHGPPVCESCFVDAVNGDDQ